MFRGLLFLTALIGCEPSVCHSDAPCKNVPAPTTQDIAWCQAFEKDMRDQPCFHEWESLGSCYLASVRCTDNGWVDEPHTMSAIGANCTNSYDMHQKCCANRWTTPVCATPVPSY